MFARRKAADNFGQFCLSFVRGAKGATGRKRGSKLPVLLNKDVEKLGKQGAQVFVEPGYARNWLIPQLLAKYDTEAGHGHRPPKRDSPGPRVKADDNLSKQFAKMSAEQKQLHQIMHRLQVSPLAIKRAVKEDGRLARSVTTASIAAAVAKQKKIALDARLIDLKGVIGSVGTYNIPLAITLGSGDRASLQLIVSS